MDWRDKITKLGGSKRGAGATTHCCVQFCGVVATPVRVDVVAEPALELRGFEFFEFGTLVAALLISERIRLVEIATRWR